MFFDSLAGKAFSARSIKLCLVDNQWSSGVAVAGFESCWFEAGSSTSSPPPIEFIPTSRKIGPTPHQVVSRFQVACEVLSCFYPLDSFVFITYSPQKALKNLFPLSYNPIVPHNFSVQFAFWILVPRCVVVFVVSRFCSWSSVNSYFQFASACDCYTQHIEKNLFSTTRFDCSIFFWAKDWGSSP